MSGYGFNFEGAVFTPDGRTDTAPSETDRQNKEIEAAEIEDIKKGPDRLFLYVGHKPMEGDPAKVYGVGQEYWTVQTWLGTFLGWACMGPKCQFPCFGRFPSVRRAVTVRIFGTLYHGWYFDSSGDYCRLKKAKRQDARYAASRWYPPAGKGTV